MDFTHDDIAAYKDHWTGGIYQAPRALRTALASLANGESVTASYVDYNFEPHGRTIWFGAWLLNDVVVHATAQADSYRDAPWEFRVESQYPREGEHAPVVHAGLLRVADLTSFEVTELRTSADREHFHADAKYRLSFGSTRIILPLNPRAQDDNQGYEGFVKAIRATWLGRQ